MVSFLFGIVLFAMVAGVSVFSRFGGSFKLCSGPRSPPKKEEKDDNPPILAMVIEQINVRNVSLKERFCFG